MADPNEAWLLYGRGPENVAHICLEGFDLKLARHQCSCGAGIYFAQSNSTSQGYTQKEALKCMQGIAPQYSNQSAMLARARSTGLKVMLLCTVLLGRVGTPQCGRQSQAPAGYESDYDSVGDLSMNVIYKSEQAYPRYVAYIRD